MSAWLSMQKISLWCAFTYLCANLPPTHPSFFFYVFFLSANQFASGFIHPERRHMSGAIEGRRQQFDTSDSEDEE